MQSLQEGYYDFFKINVTQSLLINANSLNWKKKKYILKI